MSSYIIKYSNRYGNKFNKSYDIIYTYDGINDDIILENNTSYFYTIEDYINNLSNRKQDYVSLFEVFDKNKLVNDINEYNSYSYTYSGISFNYTNSYIKDSSLSYDDLTYVHNKFTSTFNL